MARLKLFTGVNVGTAIRSNATALQQSLAKCGANVKWVEPENLHVTINFLGEVDDRDLHGICRALTAVGRKEPPFRLAVAGIGAFPTPRRPKVIWAGITDGADALKRIHSESEPRLLELGVYRREDRGYTAHLTLGRAKDEADGQLLASELAKHTNWTGGSVEVEEIVLFASELRREGPVYSVVARSPLSGG
jgi:2'-5' RNA ligase